MESRAAELLQLYGFSLREAMVYLLVLRMGSVSTGEIAKSLSLRRMEAYRLVKKLADTNAIQANAGKPVTYSAQPLESLVSAMMEAHSQKTREMELVKEELLSIGRNLPRGERRPSEQQFKILQGREQVYNKISRLAEAASSSLNLLLTRNDLIQAPGLGVTGKLNEASDRQVNVRILSFVDESTLDAVEELQGKCEVRHSDEALMGRMVVADNSAALSSLVLDDSQGRRNERDVAIYSESRNYAELMSSLFEIAYRSAAGSEERIEKVREGRALESRVRALADVLRATLPDDGWEVKSPGTLAGKSGASYEFVAAVSKENRTFGIDVVVAKKEKEAGDRVVQCVMKKLDLPEAGILVVSNRDVGEEVGKLAKLMGVTLVQTQDTLAAVSAVRRSLNPDV